MGALCLQGAEERLEFRRLLEGSCRTGEVVVGYLDLLAENAELEGKPVVVVLDNAPFHTRPGRCASGGRGGRRGG